jgi:hypothetical protein
MLSTYANVNEMAMLVDRAISDGANINYYESAMKHQLMVIAVRNKADAHALPILMARGLDTTLCARKQWD